MRNPVADNQDSLTAGESDPVLMQDFQLIEELTHQTRQRFAERAVRANVRGASGKRRGAVPQGRF